QRLDPVELPLDLWASVVERLRADLVRPSRARLGRAVERVTTVAAGEPAPVERAPDQHAHAVPLRRREHVALDLPREDRVGRLLRAEPPERTSFCGPLRLDDLEARERR